MAQVWREQMTDRPASPMWTNESEGSSAGGAGQHHNDLSQVISKGLGELGGSVGKKKKYMKWHCLEKLMVWMNWNVGESVIYLDYPFAVDLH